VNVSQILKIIKRNWVVESSEKSLEVIWKSQGMCPAMWAHWRRLANMIELVLPSARPSPQPKRQIDQFSSLCTVHGRKSLYFTMDDPFPKIALSYGDLDPI